MARNGSGAQSSPGSSFPAVANTLIESSKFNTVINDINASLTASIANDGQTPILANLPMFGFKHTGVAAATIAGQYAEYAQMNAAIAASAVTLTAAIAASAIGVAQTWQTVTRTPGVTYTNSTGKSIMLQVNGAGSSLGAATVTIDIDGISFALAQSYSGTGSVATFNGSIIIQPGKTYVMTHGNVGSVAYLELR